MSSGKLSREEIARQFQLPERKSKIANLLKQDDGGDSIGRKYCICRSSDSSRFMIACDSCEEWYHGDCIGISEKHSKHMKQYFCESCKRQDATLRSKLKQPLLVNKYEEDPDFVEDKGEKKSKRKYEWSEKTEKVEKRHYHRKKGRRCGQCSHCERDDDCGRCVACSEMRKFGGLGRTKNICLMRQCKKYPVKLKQPSTKRKRKDSSSDDDVLKDTEQCLGIGCVNGAREGSKYCSDSCGIKLATTRIYQVLPARLQEWDASPCIAAMKNETKLDEVRKQQLEVRDILHELDKRHIELDSILDRAKRASVDPNIRMEEDDTDETSTYCITCGHEIHSRMAVKHMEKCFNKYESQASFGSIYKTRIDGNNMFCDFFNPANKTYCKRLRVICPEHGKDPKISEKEVCGCPVVKNVFNLTGEFCRASKKHCSKHYCWEKLRRAEIDMERVRQWLKLDELLEQERQIRSRLATRKGVLALMLHSTYNHDLMSQVAKTQKQAESDHAYT